MDVLLYATENARNLGSIIRTSYSFGITRLYLFDTHGLLDDAHRSAIEETSMGHSAHIDLVPVSDLDTFIAGYHHKAAATLAKSSRRLGDPSYDTSLLLDTLLMFGSETSGLPRELSRAHGVTKIQIPTVGMDTCLSLPVAYGIVVYEFFRQHPELFPQRGRRS